MATLLIIIQLAMSMGYDMTLRGDLVQDKPGQTCIVFDDDSRIIVCTKDKHADIYVLPLIPMGE